MLVSFARAAFILILALILLAVGALLLEGDESGTSAAPTAVETAVPASPTAEPSPVVPTETPTRQLPVAAPTDTESVTTEPTASPEPTATPTPTIPSNAAWVNSINGLWLRAEPNVEGEQIELIPNETMLIVLRGAEPSDQPEWREVRAPSGNEGWVFIEYLIFAADR